jgi:hypothetical protein
MKHARVWALIGAVVGAIFSFLIWVAVSFIRGNWDVTDKGLREAIVFIIFSALMCFVLALLEP